MEVYMDSVQLAREEAEAEKKSLGLDRRSPGDRRKVNDLDYFQRGGKERRLWRERRKQRIEARKGWTRVSDWTSAKVASDPDSR